MNTVELLIDLIENIDEVLSARYYFECAIEDLVITTEDLVS